MDYRKKISLGFCALLSFSQAFCFDWGGMLTNNSRSKTNAKGDYYFDQGNTASLWIKAPIKGNDSNYFIAEGIYQFENDMNEPSATHYLDLTLFKSFFSKDTEKGSLELSIGRFANADLTGIIFYQNADGALLRYRTQGFSVSAYAAYTGFLNGNTVKMINAKDYVGVDPDLFYAFADKYIVANAAITFPNLFGSHTLSGQAMATFRVWENLYNRAYATLDITGPIWASIYYRVNSTFGIKWYDDESPDFGNLTMATLTIFPSALTTVSVCGVYASEDFIGFTHNPALNSYNEPDYTNLFKIGVAMTAKPIEVLLLTGSLDGAFDIGNGSRQGVQYKFGIDFMMFSDFMIGASFGQYYDLNSTDIDRTVIQVKATLAF